MPVLGAGWVPVPVLVLRGGDRLLVLALVLGAGSGAGVVSCAHGGDRLLVLGAGRRVPVPVL